MIRDFESFSNGASSRTLNFTKLPDYHYLYDQLSDSYNKYIKMGTRDKWLRLQSKYELLVFDALVNKYGYDDVIPQYGVYPTDERYPYNCDFYVKSRDIFIELNMYYSHQNHWFDENNPDDVEFLQKQKDLGTKSSLTVVSTWGGSDVKKRNIAKTNSLNYLAFWDGASEPKGEYIVPRLRDFYSWLNEYHGSYFKFIKDHPENTY